MQKEFPSNELGIPLEEFNPEYSKMDEMSSENLQKMGIHPHFVELEIETKLEIKNENATPEQVITELEGVLVGQGYVFVGSKEDRENYVVYYKNPRENGCREKIVVRNRGASGFQVKRKKQNSEKAFGSVVVKDEARSPVFESLEMAEQYLAQYAQMVDPRSCIESIVRKKACKLMLMANGSDSVVRYFRLVADEVGIMGDATSSDKLRQIEMEYKGSGSPELDNLKQIQKTMEEIMAAIKGNVKLNLRETTGSKRGWAKTKQADK